MTQQKSPKGYIEKINAPESLSHLLKKRSKRGNLPW